MSRPPRPILARAPDGAELISAIANLRGSPDQVLDALWRGWDWAAAAMRDCARVKPGETVATRRSRRVEGERWGARLDMLSASRAAVRAAVAPWSSL